MQDGAWTIVSIGRHGTLVNDRMISEATLQHQTVFRLGAEGPMLRFDTNLAEPRRSETIDNISVDMLAMLEVDEVRKQQEVDQIAGNALFQELQEQSRRSKIRSDETATAEHAYPGGCVLGEQVAVRDREHSSLQRPTRRIVQFPPGERRLAKIISTHSFRGGTGKSNTTANLAVLVARAGHRVGVIDTDIQSPGIHVIFQLAESRVEAGAERLSVGQVRDRRSGVRRDRSGDRQRRTGGRPAADLS